MSRRRCPDCGHTAALVSGRCSAPATAGICGCSCPPPARRQPRVGIGKHEELVLQALAAGCDYGLAVTEYTGLPNTHVYAALRRLRDAGLVEDRTDTKPANPGTPRRPCRLTEAGRTWAAGQGDVLPPPSIEW